MDNDEKEEPRFPDTSYDFLDTPQGQFAANLGITIGEGKAYDRVRQALTEGGLEELQRLLKFQKPKSLKKWAKYVKKHPDLYEKYSEKTVGPPSPE